MLNLIQFLLAVVLVGYILIGYWESIPILAALAWHDRAGALAVWCLLYVASSAFLAVRFHSDKQFWPLTGWSLGVVWTIWVIFTLLPVVAAQFFLFVLTPKGWLLSIIANIVAGTAGILLGNLLIFGLIVPSSFLGVYWMSWKNPFFLQGCMLNLWEKMGRIPPTTRSINWPAKAIISLMVAHETIRDWGWV